MSKKYKRMKSKYVCQRVRTLKSNNSKSQLIWITELNMFLKKSGILMMITFLNWKMKAKFNQIFLRGLFLLTLSHMCPCYLPFQSLVFRSLSEFPTKTAASTVMNMALLAPILYWVTNTQYLMRHWSFSSPFLFSA